MNTPNGYADHTQTRGIRGSDPVTMMVDSLCRYAEDHAARYESKLAHDGVLGPAWLDMAKGLRDLLNGGGLFDGGTLDSAICNAINNAGFDPEEWE